MFYQYTATFQHSSRTVFIKAVLAAKGSLNSEQTQLHALDKDHNVLVPIGNIGMLSLQPYGGPVGVQQLGCSKDAESNICNNEPKTGSQTNGTKITETG
jgi:hypothetical protein